MAKCSVCGNDYDKAFQVTMSGKSQTFDSFECMEAIRDGKPNAQVKGNSGVFLHGRYEIQV